ncbi:MAG: ATP-binding protein [Pseudomonadota bacterium]
MNELPTDVRLWNALPNPSLILSRQGVILALNGAAENFLAASERQLRGRPLAEFAGSASRVLAIVDQAAREGITMADYDVELTWPDTPTRLVDLSIAPVPSQASDGEGELLLMLQPRAIAETMDRSLSHRDAARSITGMAAMLAHEIKNPLAGISGAAQLLEMNLGQRDRELTDLIRAEADRITQILTQVEEFGAIGPRRSVPVNIHDVLDRSVQSAKAGFARHVRFLEEYDPSLPPVIGDPDQLIQIFINLLKNAAEATPEVGGLITVRTAYRAGIKVIGPSGRRASLPLQVTIADNGTGVPDGLKRHIFEPFVTSKSNGSGLGLAFVSKAVSDHGGVISCESEPGWTRMKLRLPIATAQDLASAPDETAEQPTAAGE